MTIMFSVQSQFNLFFLQNRLSDDQLDLLRELSCLVNSPTMSDAVIQIDDGSKLHVHSFMIQLRCPALAAVSMPMRLGNYFLNDTVTQRKFHFHLVYSHLGHCNKSQA